MDGDRADISVVARLMGEPARAAMLDALLCGQALAAGELGRVAQVSAATASEHLSRLREGGLVEVVAAGRHRYYRLASADVARALEVLALISPRTPIRSLRQSRSAAALAVARTCYDHLAGQVGVALHDALVQKGSLVADGDRYLLTEAGAALLDEIGVVRDGAGSTTWKQAPSNGRPGSRRPFARPCLDFTERRPHLAGALGAALCERLLADGWLVRRVAGQRPLHVTPRGQERLSIHFGIALPPP
jgi:DNA-binding transcriptional ArsR family regulator